MHNTAIGSMYAETVQYASAAWSDSQDPLKAFDQSGSAERRHGPFCTVLGVALIAAGLVLFCAAVAFSSKSMVFLGTSAFVAGMVVLATDRRHPLAASAPRTEPVQIERIPLSVVLDYGRPPQTHGIRLDDDSTDLHQTNPGEFNPDY